LLPFIQFPASLHCFVPLILDCMHTICAHDLCPTLLCYHNLYDFCLSCSHVCITPGHQVTT
jgi:hypothetical protein